MPAARVDPQQLFQGLDSYRHIALAVSGGSDSVALMQLAAQWAAEQSDKPQLSVLTVDHGLRAASAFEAEQVGRWANTAGLPHAIVQWKGPRPHSGLQAKARAARYDLMSQWCVEHGAQVLLTAHTMDDQAETVLMRLARTTSFDSLASIHRRSRWGDVELFRPLLGTKRSDLRSYLSNLGQEWIDDPSNEDERFERVRIRKAMPVLAGLGITAETLARVAEHALEVTHALWGAADDWIELHITRHHTGYCEVPVDAYKDQAEALKPRILATLIGCYGAGRMPEPSELELLAAWVDAGSLGRRTLGGALIALRQRSLLIGREPGRIDPLPAVVAADGKLLWDGRFEVLAEPKSKVVPAGSLPDLARREDIPAFVEAGLPAVIQPGGAVCVPHLRIGKGAEAVFRPNGQLTGRLR